MAKPRKVNIGILQALRDVKTDETKQSAQDEQRRESGGKRGVQRSTSKHQNHRIVVVDGPANVEKGSSWLAGLSPAVR
jgi:hypothetical protein